MSRRFFVKREPIGVTMRRNRGLLDAMVTDRARFEADFPESNLPTLPKKRIPREPGVDIDAIHRKQPLPLEAQVLRAVGDLIEVHPLVAFAIRQNSGAASYEAKSGRYAPVHFYKWIKRPEPMTLPDIWGMLITGRPFFFEVKRAGWTKPTDERERQQAAFLSMVRTAGHIGKFITDAEQVSEALK